jgi:hypothetical protein
VQANQVREKDPKRTTRRFPQPVQARELNGKRCPFCSVAIQSQITICPSCGRPLKSGNSGLVSLKDALLFGAILLLVSMAIAPVWPKEQIYGKSIQFLLQLGWVIPKTPDGAAAFRHQMMNVVQLYQGINLMHYIFISAFVYLYVIHLFLISRQAFGYSNKVWIILGLLLMIFPAVNLVVSWSMFLSPGVLGTALASIFVVIAGSFLK